MNKIQGFLFLSSAITFPIFLKNVRNSSDIFTHCNDIYDKCTDCNNI